MVWEPAEQDFGTHYFCAVRGAQFSLLLDLLPVLCSCVNTSRIIPRDRGDEKRFQRVLLGTTRSPSTRKQWIPQYSLRRSPLTTAHLHPDPQATLSVSRLCKSAPPTSLTLPQVVSVSCPILNVSLTSTFSKTPQITQISFASFTFNPTSL